MTGADVVTYAKHSELQQLAVVRPTTDPIELAHQSEALLSYINLGLIELYKRFDLSVKVEIVRTSPLVSVYQLRNNDIQKVIDIYDADGKSLRTPSINGEHDYDINLIAHNTYLFKAPREEDIAFVYSSAPILLKTMNDTVDIPIALLEALLHYIGYRAHAALNGNIDSENNTHYSRFEKSCNEAMLQGFGSAVDLTNVSIETKGYV